MIRLASAAPSRRAAHLLVPLVALLGAADQALADPDTGTETRPRSSPTQGHQAHWPGVPDADTVVLNVAGDISYPNDWGGIQEIDARQQALFELVQPILDSADLNFANLECPFTDTPAVVTKEFPIACQQKRLAYITGAGFNLFSLANNHSADAGATGIDDTLDLLRRSDSAERPLWWSGTGADANEARKPALVQPPGKNTRFALFAVANGSYKGRIASIHDPSLAERVAQAKKEADVVLVSVHYGPEYVHVPSSDTVKRYHALIDAGADMVIAHHPHVVQGVERYKSGFIFYSLGNFSFGSKTRRHLATGARLYSMIGRITFAKGEIARVELIPLYANNGFKWTQGDATLEPRHATPQLLAKDFAHAALDEFEAFARDIPGAEETRFERVGDRVFVDLGRGEMSDAERFQSLHEQTQEYMAAVLASALPRLATDGEKRVAGRGGTPDSAVRAAQEQGGRDQKKSQKQSQKDKKGKKGQKQQKAQKTRGKKSAKGKGRARGARKR